MNDWRPVGFADNCSARSAPGERPAATTERSGGGKRRSVMRMHAYGMVVRTHPPGA